MTPPPGGPGRSQMRQSAGSGATFFFALDGYHPVTELVLNDLTGKAAGTGATAST